MTHRKPILGLCITLLAAVIVLLAAAPAGASYESVDKWGSLGAGTGQFDNPRGIATDSNDNVYVVDSGNGRIQKFDSDGGFLVEWETSVRGLLQDIATDTQSNVYVSMWNFCGDGSCGAKVEKFDSEGNFITRWDSADQVSVWASTGIAADSKDNVYATFTGQGCFYTHCRYAWVSKFDSTGSSIDRWGSLGSGDGQFDPAEPEPGGYLALGGPFAIATDSQDHVYVGDEGNNRIQKFDSSGTFISKCCFGPGGTATDSNDNVFATDPDLNRVGVFDSSGGLLERFGDPGGGDGQLAFPTGIATDSQDNVYVADSGNDRIQKFAYLPPDTAAYGSAHAKPTQRKRGNRIRVKLKLRAQEELAAKVGGEVIVNRGASAGAEQSMRARTYRLEAKSRQLQAGQTKSLFLKPNKRKHARRIARVLKKGKKVTAKLEVKLTDAAENTKTENLSVKLRRPR